MLLTKDKIYEDYLELHKGQKNWLLFLIMAPILFFFGMAMGGNVIVGFIFVAIFGIVVLVRSLSGKMALKKVKNGNYRVVRDTVINKKKVRRYSKPSRYCLTTEVIYKKSTDVIPSYYDAVEIGDTFVAVYAGNRMLKIYNLKEYALSSEVSSKMQ